SPWTASFHFPLTFLKYSTKGLIFGMKSEHRKVLISPTEVLYPACLHSIYSVFGFTGMTWFSSFSLARISLIITLLTKSYLDIRYLIIRIVGLEDFSSICLA